ncbi:TerB family tellurite resistance protein [Thermodesulfobacteriota bacterium]
MIDIVKKYFGKSPKTAENKNNKDVKHNIKIASCALLLEMSCIDGEFDPSEQERIISIIKRDFQLSDEEADAILKASKEELDGSIDLWRFTKLINENYSAEEKLGIIETVWKVAYADGKLDKHEDYLVHKLAQLLHVDHNRLMAAKSKVKGE